MNDSIIETDNNDENENENSINNDINNDINIIDLNIKPIKENEELIPK